MSASTGQRYLRKRESVPRRRPRRGLRVVLLALTAAAGAASGWAGSRLLWSELQQTSFLRLARIDVEGAERSSPEQLRAGLRTLLGLNLLAIELPAVREQLLSQPWVEDATVQRVFPDRLVVSVIEQRPAAVDLASGQLLDQRGRPILGTRAGDASGELPIVAADDPAGWQRAGTLLEVLSRTRPPLLPRSGLVDTRDPANTLLELRDSRLSLQLGAGRHAQRLNRFLNVESVISERYPDATSVDLRFDGRVVVAPRQ